MARARMGFRAGHTVVAGWALAIANPKMRITEQTTPIVTTEYSVAMNQLLLVMANPVVVEVKWMIAASKSAIATAQAVVAPQELSFARYKGGVVKSERGITARKAGLVKETGGKLHFIRQQVSFKGKM